MFVRRYPLAPLVVFYVVLGAVCAPLAVAQHEWAYAAFFAAQGSLMTWLLHTGMNNT